MKKHTLINPYKYLKTFLILVLCFILLLITSKCLQTKTVLKRADKQYVILAYNDLGMHCIQNDYSAFMILPPANTVRVQVFEKGVNKAKIVTDGVIVEYKVNNNTSSIDKVNFWEYSKDYGYDLKPNEGITGNFLSGICKQSKDKKYYEAELIPVTPYNDGIKERNPYQTMTVTVKDAATKEVIAKEDAVVVPVSDEMMCSNCHGTVDTYASILKVHDRRQKTSLYTDLKNNKRHKCNECHEDNALGAQGVKGIPSLSLAIHNFHAPLMGMSKLENDCYNCHPGVETKCSRGAMAKVGITCSDSKCHGDMETMAKSIKDGRKPWINEPNCSNCHGALYGTKDMELYREAYLENGPSAMNGKIKCGICHNSPHAEWISTLPLDNEIPKKIYGKPDFIRECTACHDEKVSGKIHDYRENRKK